MIKYILFIFFPTCLFANPATFDNEQEMTKSLGAFMGKWHDDELEKILISPLICGDGKFLASSGYGELDAQKAQTFAKAISDAKRFEWLANSEGGRLVKLHFIYKGRGFKREDEWVCKIHKDNTVVVVFPIKDNPSYLMRLPQEAARIIISAFITKIGGSE